MNSTIFARLLLHFKRGNKIEILFPPHTPRCKFLALLGVMVVSWNLTTAVAQSYERKAVELQSFEMYQQSLKSYYVKSWQAQRKEFQDLNVKSFLYYLPAVGFQFGLPSIQFSTQTFLNWKRDKKITESKLNSLDARLELELNQQLQEVRTEFVKIQYEFDKIKAFERSWSSMKGIWAVKQECCNKQQCTPLECRQVEFESLQWEEKSRVMKADFVILILDLEKLAKYDLPNEKLK